LSKCQVKRIKKLQYSPEDLKKAFKCIEENKYSVKKTSEVFNIPGPTLISRKKGWKNRAQSKQDNKILRKTFFILFIFVRNVMLCLFILSPK
jgi:hypothetical protein